MFNDVHNMVSDGMKTEKQVQTRCSSAACGGEVQHLE